jgi:hypothetical protein
MVSSFQGDLLFGCVVSAFSLLFVGSLAQTPLLVEAARRRRWGLILSGHIEVVILLRAVEYAFGPRRVTHPHPRFVPGRLSLGFHGAHHRNASSSRRSERAHHAPASAEATLGEKSHQEAGWSSVHPLTTNRTIRDGTISCQVAE